MRWVLFGVAAFFAAATLVFAALFIRAQTSEICARIKSGADDQRILKRAQSHSVKWKWIMRVIRRTVLAIVAIGAVLCVVQSVSFRLSDGKIYGPFIPLAVASGSMSSVYPGYDLPEGATQGFAAYDLVVIGKADENELDCGDVIAFYSSQGKLIIHRITRKFVANGQTYFVTRGDANPSDDGEAVGYSSVVGKYTGVKIAFVGAVVLFLRSWYGLAAMVFVIFLAAAYDRSSSKIIAAERARLSVVGADENKI